MLLLIPNAAISTKSNAAEKAAALEYSAICNQFMKISLSKESVMNPFFEPIMTDVIDACVNSFPQSS
jgi:hypothetical protein